LDSIVDVIGDIHGHATKLEELLLTLGYTQKKGVWQHSERKVLFLGDFIDRGPEQLKTLNIARGMVENGHARAVMGNHELNAIGWHTRGGDGFYLRPRHGQTGQKNENQHKAFLGEVGADTPLHTEWVSWFKSLPLWIEESSFRAVHACWSVPHADEIMNLISDDACVADDAFHLFFNKTHKAFDCAEVLLKGPELELPGGHYFVDKDGHERTAIRTKWWAEGLDTYADAYIGPPGAEIPELPLNVADTVQPVLDKPTFIGHYWLNPEHGIAPLSSKVACLDYSVARGGKLAAYSYAGESELSGDRFVAV